MIQIDCGSIANEARVLPMQRLRDLRRPRPGLLTDTSRSTPAHIPVIPYGMFIYRYRYSPPTTLPLPLSTATCCP